MHIARVLTEFGWVRELNEGVKRIYSDMADFFLEPPEYTEPSGVYVRLTLKNNIKVRSQRREERAEDAIGTDAWGELDDLEREMLAFMGSRKEVTRAELEKITGRTRKTISRRLNHLMERNIIHRKGDPHDPMQRYVLG